VSKQERGEEGRGKERAPFSGQLDAAVTQKVENKREERAITVNEVGALCLFFVWCVFDFFCFVLFCFVLLCFVLFCLNGVYRRPAAGWTLLARTSPRIVSPEYVRCRGTDLNHGSDSRFVN